MCLFACCERQRNKTDGLESLSKVLLFPLKKKLGFLNVLECKKHEKIGNTMPESYMDMIVLIETKIIKRQVKNVWYIQWGKDKSISENACKKRCSCIRGYYKVDVGKNIHKQVRGMSALMYQ